MGINAREFFDNAARNMAAINRTLPTAQEVVETWAGNATKGAGMSEEEILGKLAYDAYHDDAIAGYGGMPGSTITVLWEDQGSSIRQHWIAAAKAVVGHVLQEVQTAADVSD